MNVVRLRVLVPSCETVPRYETEIWHCGDHRLRAYRWGMWPLFENVVKGLAELNWQSYTLWKRSCLETRSGQAERVVLSLEQPDSLPWPGGTRFESTLLIVSSLSDQSSETLRSGLELGQPEEDFSLTATYGYMHLEGQFMTLRPEILGDCIGIVLHGPAEYLDLLYAKVFPHISGDGEFPIIASNQIEDKLYRSHLAFQAWRDKQDYSTQ